MATSRKIKFIEKVIHDISYIMISFHSLEDSIDIFLDRGYNTGGDDPITETDLEPYEMTYSEFTAVNTFINNFKLFLENGEPAVNDYREMLNNIRDDR
jgi:hypothetical protein